MLTFENSSGREAFLSQPGNKTWFDCVKPGASRFVITDRLAWLEVEGVPLDAWGVPAFDKVLRKWGELQFLGETDHNNLYSRQACILTNNMDNIAGSIEVICSGIKAVVRVRELVGWIPAFSYDDSRVEENAVHFKSNETEGHEEEESDSEEEGLIGEEDDFMQEEKEIVGEEKEVTNSDPFNLQPLLDGFQVENNQTEDLQLKATSSSDSSLNFPPGFEPRVMAVNIGGVGSPDHVPGTSSVSVIEELSKTVEVGRALGINLEGLEQDIEQLIKNGGGALVS